MGASVLAYAPLLSAQPGKVWRIGFLGATSAAGYTVEIDAIRARFRELGYVEGRNILIEFRWAQGDPEKLEPMALELVALKPDVIITHAIPPTRASAQATRTIPIIMADGQDPVVAGLAATYAKPGGNVTGSTSFQAEITGKRLEFLMEAVPRVKRVAVIFNPSNPNAPYPLNELEKAAAQMKVDLFRFTAKATEEIPGAFAAMSKQRVDALVVGEDPLINTNNAAIAALAASHRLPSTGFTNLPDAGGLIGYGANRPLLYARAANFADKIFKGAKAGDLPIERATKFDLIINLKTARALGIKIPQSLLQRADRVIQ